MAVEENKQMMMTLIENLDQAQGQPTLVDMGRSRSRLQYVVMELEEKLEMEKQGYQQEECHRSALSY